MSGIASWIMGGALLALSVGLLRWQLRDEEPPLEELDEESIAFFRRQWWRRMQVAVWIGIVGAAIIGGQWIAEPLATGIFWLGVLLIVAWIAILGMIDMWVSRDRLDAEARLMDQERDKLIAELEKEAKAFRSKRTTAGNGDGK